MTDAPQIPGYRFAEQLLDHPLATVWRGAATGGHEVVALVLTDAGAADQIVRDRLATASRDAALQPSAQEAPLWAANLTTAHPYAITQLAPGLSGAERLLDPLDGVIGNDRSAIAEVRARLEAAPINPPLNGPAATIPTYAEPTTNPETPYAGTQDPSTPYADTQAPSAGTPVTQTPGTQTQPTTQSRPGTDGGTPTSVGWLLWTLVVIVPLVAFVATYSIGASVNSAMADDEPTQPRRPVPSAVQPSPLPTRSVLLPGIPKAPQVALRTVKNVYLVGNSFVRTENEPLALGLPFVMHRPDEELQFATREESSYSIYRVLVYGKPTKPTGSLSIAAHPCASRPACLAERATFDSRWTSRFKAVRPVQAAGDRTWIAESDAAGYAVSMTRVYRSPATGGWWLIGVAADVDDAANKTLVQAGLNDIRTQTS